MRLKGPSTERANCDRREGRGAEAWRSWSTAADGNTRPFQLPTPVLAIPRGLRCTAPTLTPGP